MKPKKLIITTKDGEKIIAGSVRATEVPVEIEYNKTSKDFPGVVFKEKKIETACLPSDALVDVIRSENILNDLMEDIIRQEMVKAARRIEKRLAKELNFPSQNANP